MQLNSAIAIRTCTSDLWKLSKLLIMQRKESSAKIYRKWNRHERESRRACRYSTDNLCYLLHLHAVAAALV